ncbi:MAG: gamma-glutamylcyclotransferase [Streptosporangiales bacterium]|nr:gamma-glutamylcyclotransferase [Streptosporangiales bacterium]
MVPMFLNGTAMRGGAAHDALQGARLVAEISSAPRYRFFAVRGEFPGMTPAVPGETGCRVAGELYELPLDVLRDSLLPTEPPELELGVIELANGEASLAMVLRDQFRGHHTLEDISALGSWREYQQQR